MQAENKLSYAKKKKIFYNTPNVHLIFFSVTGTRKNLRTLKKKEKPRFNHFLCKVSWGGSSDVIWDENWLKWDCGRE